MTVAPRPTDAARDAMRDGDFAACVAICTDNLDSRGDAISAAARTELRRLRGLAAHALNDNELAVRELTHAFWRDVTDRPVAVALGRLLIERGEDARAWDVLENVLAHHGETMPARGRSKLTVRLARSYMASGNALAARRALEAVRPHLAEISHAEALFADALAATGERERAIALRRRLLHDATSHRTRTGVALQLAEDLRRAGRDMESADVLETVAASLDEALDADSSDAALFEDQVRLLRTAESWGALHDAYKRMAARLERRDPDNHATLALLWRRMGDLSETRLRLRERAESEYAQAESHRERSEHTALRLEPTGTYEAVGAADSIWTALSTEPADLELAREYAERLDARGDTAHAEAVRQAAAAYAGAPAPPGIESQHGASPLSNAHRLRFVRPTRRRAALDTVFVTATRVAPGHFFGTAESLGILARDAIPSTDAAPIVQVFAELSAVLGYASPPALYRDRREDGLSVVPTFAPTFRIGRSALRASDGPILRFRVGQILGLRREELVLAGLLSRARLEDTVEALTGHRLGPRGASDRAWVARLRVQADRSMTVRHRNALEHARARLEARTASGEIATWLALVSDEIARVGLLCAGDIRASIDAVRRFSPLVDGPEPDARALALARYAMSPAREALRRTRSSRDFP